MQGFYHHFQLPTPPTPATIQTDAVHEWLHWTLFVQPREREIDRLIAAGQPVEAYLLAIENWQQEGSK